MARKTLSAKLVIGLSVLASPSLSSECLTNEQTLQERYQALEGQFGEKPIFLGESLPDENRIFPLYLGVWGRLDIQNGGRNWTVVILRENGCNWAVMDGQTFELRRVGPRGIPIAD